MFCRPCLLVLAVLLTARGLDSPAHAELKLPSIINDHMVLQRDRPVILWGWDRPGTDVTVSLDDASESAQADAEGRWQVELPALPAGGPHRVTVKGSSERVLNDVLVGEVWLCSGQSNMEWTVAASANAEAEAAAASHPRLRHIKIPRTPAAEPQQDVEAGPWQAAAPQTVGSFSAVGYYFARQLQEELDVPVGIIGSNWGGTRIEPWTPPVGFQAIPALQEITARLENYPARNAEGAVNHQSPTALYNGMIAPLVPFQIRGTLWYQGESNNGEGMLYHEKMKALIHGWRSLWSNPEMPFYFVQLAPYTYGGDPFRLPGIWEAQAATLEVPHTGMAVTVDIADLDDIHPRNKQDVGRRLALWALAKTYGQSNRVHSGPLYKSMKVEGNAIRLAFDHVGGGLVSRDDRPLNWFEIAADDGDFVQAQANIDGDTVVVRAAGVNHPTAVRFGWHQRAEPNLANREGLPASPFRTRR